MSIRRALFAGLIIALPSSHALAWNGRGHMIVAAVAWTHMTQTAQDRVGQLLKLNPFYASWTKGVPAGQKDQIAFVIGATWPDQIKKWKGNCPAAVTPNKGPVSKYTYCNDSDAPTHDGADANKGYTDRLEHRYWHFIDMPFSPDGTPLVQPVPPNARTEIEVFRTTVESNAAGDKLKSYDLVWLEHLVGDVHQPLHATSRFTSAFTTGDRGGNLVCTGTALTTNQSGAQVCKTELHAYWDNVLGLQKSKATDATNARAAIQIAQTLAPAAAADVADDNLDHWVSASFELAKGTAYAAPVGTGEGPYDIASDATYASTAATTAQAQAELAGERLAKLLNDHLR
jgi:hypothetical protein